METQLQVTGEEIRIQGSSNNEIRGNTVTNNYYGIRVVNSGTVTSSNNHIIGNNVMNNGYGISTTSSPTATVADFNIIVGNTYGVETDTGGFLNANNNWWGSNTGPNTAGSDITSGPVTATQWLILTLTADPNSIGNGGTSTITADLNHVNGGGIASGGYIPDGTQISFATTLGNIVSTATTLNGEAKPTLSTTTSDLGTATITATLNNENQQTTVTVLYLPVKNIDTGKAYTSIKEAVEDPATLNGHTITVAAGEYTGNNNYGIIINKNLIIIGENKDTTIINAQLQDRVFIINPGITLSLENLTIENGNSADGGAIYVDGNSNTVLTINNCILCNNFATYGGAIYNRGVVNIFNSNFYNNNAGDGGAIYNWGLVNIFTSNFYNNNAGDTGGVIRNTMFAGLITVIGSIFDNNIARYGGFFFGQWINIYNSIFSNNRASASGGVIYGGVFSVTGSTFYNNVAVQKGGAIWNAGTDGPSSITGSTFYNNNANSGGAIYNGESWSAGTLFMHFNRIVGNSNPCIYNRNGVVDAQYNWWGSNVDPSGILGGWYPVSSDPWLKLSIAADPTEVVEGMTSQVTANLYTDSAGIDHSSEFAKYPAVIPVTFATTWGSIGQAVLNYGTNKVTFTANGGSPVPNFAVVSVADTLNPTAAVTALITIKALPVVNPVITPGNTGTGTTGIIHTGTRTTGTGTRGNGQQTTTSALTNEGNAPYSYGTPEGKQGNWLSALLSYWWIILLLLILIGGGFLWFLLAARNRGG